MNTRLFKNDHSHFIQENNFSFAGVAGINQHIYWQNIVVYYNGVRIWGTAPGELPPEPEPEPESIPRHGTEFIQHFNDELGNLVEPHINDIDIEMLSYIYGIYRITLSTSNVTLDSRAETPFFFWNSNEGVFDEIIEYDNYNVSFIFSANEDTAGRNVRLVIGIGDSLGQVDRVAVYLKGNDSSILNESIEPVIQPLSIQARLPQILPISTAPAVFDRTATTNISFAIDNTISNIAEISDILASIASLAPHGSYVSLVDSHNITGLSRVGTISNQLQRLQPSRSIDVSQLLERAASTLRGGYIQNVILLLTNSITPELIQNIHQLESEGFVVYLIIDNEYVVNPASLLMAHPNSIIYYDVDDLQEQLQNLPVFIPIPFARFSLSEQVFIDVPSSHWAAVEINDLVRRRVIVGMSDIIFAPNVNVTIEHFMIMSMRIVYGSGDGDFEQQDYRNFEIALNLLGPEIRSNDNITNVHSMYLLERVYRALGGVEGFSRLENVPFNPAARLNASYFADYRGVVLPEHQAAVSRFFHGSVIPGIPFIIEGGQRNQTGRNLNPLRIVTRADAASLLFRLVTPPSFVAGDLRELHVMYRLVDSVDLAEIEILNIATTAFDIVGGEALFRFIAERSGVHYFTAYGEAYPRVFLVNRGVSNIVTFQYQHRYPEGLTAPVRRRVSHYLQAGQEVLISAIGSNLAGVGLRIEESREEEITIGNIVHDPLENYPYPSEINRGTVLQYRNMNIGWPLGLTGSGTRVYVSEAGYDEPPRYVWIYEEDRSMNGASYWFGTRGGGFHIGFDIVEPLSPNGGVIHGTPIIAVTDGYILTWNTTWPTASTGQGFFVSIRSNLRDPETGQYLIFNHQHMQFPLAPELRIPGLPVYRGQIIGFVGNSGATGSSAGHLHFEVTNSGNTWGTLDDEGDTNNRSRVLYRINPRFFYDEDAFIHPERFPASRNTMGIWNERRP